MKESIKFGVSGFFIAISFLVGFIGHTQAAVQDEIEARNQRIQEIQQQIEQYQQEIDALGGKSLTLQNEINKLNSQIKKAQLEIQSLSLSISQTGSEINQTQGQIQDAQSKLDLHKATLGKLISILYQSDQQNLTEVFLKNGRLSDFFNDVNNIKTTQENIKDILEQIKSIKTDLEQKKDVLEDKQAGLEDLKSIQETAKRNADAVKKDRANILAKTRGQESKFQQLVKESKLNIARIQEEVYYLRQNGVSVEDAIKYGNLAAIATGIRPAFLIAELEVESSLGRNVGKCVIVDTTSGSTRHIVTGKVSARGINPTRDLAPFLKITSELGKDPFQTPVSCWPGFGWGGAMGPAQFIPSTWMGYRAEVARLTGHNPPSPWDIGDAFTASAAKLARGGATAKTRAAEIAASKAYYSGNPRCSTVQCNRYASAVQNIAAEIEKNL